MNPPELIDSVDPLFGPVGPTSECPEEVPQMYDTPDVSPEELRAELSPVSERFAAFELGDSLVVFDEDDADRWILSDTACDREAMR